MDYTCFNHILCWGILANQGQNYTEQIKQQKPKTTMTYSKTQ